MTDQLASNLVMEDTPDVPSDLVVVLDALERRDDAAWWACGWANSSGRSVTLRAVLSLTDVAPERRTDEIVSLNDRLSGLQQEIARAYPRLHLSVDSGFETPFLLANTLTPDQVLVIMGDGGIGSLLASESSATGLALHAEVPTMIVPRGCRIFGLGPVGIEPLRHTEASAALALAQIEAARLNRPLLKITELADLAEAPAFAMIARPPKPSSLALLPAWRGFRHTLITARWAVLVVPPDEQPAIDA